MVLNKRLITFLELGKPIISLSVALSSLTGYILYNKCLCSGWIALYIGVLFVAAGSAAINQIQELKFDKLMERTLSRPLPSGKISIKAAWVFTIVMVATGLTILCLNSGLQPMILALVTLLWYNAIYTPLKRLTPWAILPGALVGAIPPAIGWTAAGGSPFDQDIVFISFFFFLGQMPHFWLILLKYGEEYKNAGFPSIHDHFSKDEISRITRTWTIATALSAIFLPFFNIITSYIASLAAILSAVIVIIFFARHSKLSNKNQITRAFIIINSFFLFIMLLIISDALIF